MFVRSVRFSLFVHTSVVLRGGGRGWGGPSLTLRPAGNPVLLSSPPQSSTMAHHGGLFIEEVPF